MVDGGMRKCSAGACPPQGSGWGVAESVVPIRCTKPQLPLFIPWCAGANRHGRLVRKCALQSPSIPALRRRNVPNCRPMADGGMRKCSAGACPPQGSGWGVAESVVPIRCTKPQLRLFILWCAGANRHERLVRKWCYAASSMPECHRPPLRHSGDRKHAPYPDTGPESRGVGRGDCSAGACPQPGSHGHPAGESRHPPHHPCPHFAIPAPTSSCPRRRESTGGTGGAIGPVVKDLRTRQIRGSKVRLLYLDGRGLR